MSVFETGYKDDMNEEEAIELVSQAILAGVYNDLGSGSNVDVCILKKDSMEMKRNYLTPMDEKPLRASVKKPSTFGVYPPGTTKVVKVYEEVFADAANEMDVGA